MITVLKPNENIIALLGDQEIKKNSEYRMMRYCIVDNSNDCILVHNLITKELIKLTRFEYEKLTCNSPYDDNISDFVKKWFMVPIEYNEYTISNQVRTIFEITRKKDYINVFTVYTTTECNARCFYCYQNGMAKSSMTDDVALATAEYISKVSKNNRVEIEWFGGEPLCNMRVINLITSQLKTKKINFISSMVSNGFLFNKELVDRAKNEWNLKNIQITLDGTEPVYNRIKNYVCQNDEINPFGKVCDNIKYLLKSGIKVCVRLNVYSGSFDDLNILSDFLIKEFSAFSNFKINVEIVQPNNIMKEYNVDELEKLIRFRDSLHDLFEKKNLLRIWSIEREPIVDVCMMNNDSMVAILPNGNITKCADSIDALVVGTVFDGKLHPDKISNLKKIRNYTEKCSQCAFYPDCIELECCPSNIYPVCEPADVKEKICYHKRQMRYTYKKWMKEIHDKTS